MSSLAWLLPGVPSAAGGLMLLSGRRGDRIAAPAALFVSAATLGLAIAAAVVRPAARAPFLEGLPVGLAVDGLSAVMVVTVAAVTLAVLVFAAGETRSSGRDVSGRDVSGRDVSGRGFFGRRFFGFMLLFAGAMLVTVTATDLVVLLMAWEVMGAMSYALIGYRWGEPDPVRSADVAFVTTRAGDMGLYLAAGCALAGPGTMGLGALPGADGAWRDLIAAGVIAAALGKSAQLPFSFWLSRAMAGPSPVSALLHSATMVAAGAYLLLRLEPLLTATGWAGPLVAWVGALTALLLGAVAIAQTDLKQLLAASTCAQLGFMVLAAGAGSVSGGAAHLVAHAAVKSLLFLGAGAWLAALGTKDLAELHGAARRHPLVGVTFGIGALALAGLPPLSLWVTKDTVLAAAAHRSPALYVVGLAGAAVAAAYSAKALIAVVRPADAATRDLGTGQGGAGQGGGGRGDGGQRGGGRLSTGRVGLLEGAPLPVLALVAAGFGVVGIPAVFGSWHDLVGGPDEPAASAWELVASGGLAVLAVLLVVLVVVGPGRDLRVAGPLTGLPAGWLYLERAAVVLVERPVMAAARALAAFDDRVVDGGVRLAAALGRAGSGLMTLRVEIRVDVLVRGLARGVRLLAALARRPQTGQVHAYYAQAAVALIALAVVLIAIG